MTAPPRQAYDVFDHLCAQIDVQIARLRELCQGEAASFNQLVRDAGLPAPGNRVRISHRGVALLRRVQGVRVMFIRASALAIIPGKTADR